MMEETNKIIVESLDDISIDIDDKASRVWGDDDRSICLSKYSTGECYGVEIRDGEETIAIIEEDGK